MKFATAQTALVPRSQSAKVIAWVYAAVLVVMAIGQLFAFEKFLPLMDTYNLPGGHGEASLTACLIVLTEVFALPFLLRMPLSIAMRWFSLICGVIVPLIWLKLSFFVLITSPVLTNSGMLGDKVSVHAGVAQLIVSTILFMLAILATYGLWPGKNSTAKK